MVVCQVAAIFQYMMSMNKTTDQVLTQMELLDMMSKAELDLVANEALE